MGLARRIARLEAAQEPDLPEYEDWFPAHQRHHARMLGRFISVLCAPFEGASPAPVSMSSRWLEGDTPEQAEQDAQIVALGFRHRTPTEWRPTPDWWAGMDYRSRI